jgi:hypothetical protein
MNHKDVQIVEELEKLKETITEDSEDNSGISCPVGFYPAGFLILSH